MHLSARLSPTWCNRVDDNYSAKMYTKPRPEAKIKKNVYRFGAKI